MRFFRFFAVCFFYLPAVGQNLVPNPGFEDYRRCPGSFARTSEEMLLQDWYSPNSGTPDYFNECSNGEAGVPYNWAGVSEAWEGNGYAGIYTWLAQREFREYLQCRLTQPLLRDSTYLVSFRYKLSSYSKYSSDRIALLLSDSAERRKNDHPFRIVPTLNAVADSALTPSTGLWEIASFTYKATGGERYVTIGNFDDNKSTRVYRIVYRPEQQEMLATASYYYIDDVYVSPLFGEAAPLPRPPRFSGDDVVADQLYVLDNILFEFNSYHLMQASFPQLNEVLAVLNGDASLNVNITGHTDDIGENRYNKKLSVQRAEAVARFLISNGIAEDRIGTRGFGEDRPLVIPADESSRAVNRRVEIVFFR